MPKGTPRDQSVQHAILHRMKIARGHLFGPRHCHGGSGHYCIDVIHQSLAVQALKSIDQGIENHMETCVADAISAATAKKY